eukprot:9374812-Pyramimonas_sp.AAC.1
MHVTLLKKIFAVRSGCCCAPCSLLPEVVEVVEVGAVLLEPSEAVVAPTSLGVAVDVLVPSAVVVAASEPTAALALVSSAVDSHSFLAAAGPPAAAAVGTGSAAAPPPAGAAEAAPAPLPSLLPLRSAAACAFWTASNLACESLAASRLISSDGGSATGAGPAVSATVGSTVGTLACVAASWPSC